MAERIIELTVGEKDWTRIYAALKMAAMKLKTYGEKEELDRLVEDLKKQAEGR